MSESTKSTPSKLPWRKDEYFPALEDADHRRIGTFGLSGDMEAHANAELIVRSVNNFPALVEALEEIVREAKEYDIADCDHDAGICNCSMRLAVKQAILALKAAKGE